MKKYISYDKLSKKEKRNEDNKKRILWSEFSDINTVTRTVKSKKKYDRKKSKADLMRKIRYEM